MSCKCATECNIFCIAWHLDCIVLQFCFAAAGGGLYGIDSCPNYIALHRIKIVAHCVPTRNAITRVMLSLGEGQGGLWDGGANLFSASCIPADAPPSLPHSYFVLFNVSVSKNVAVAFRADRVGLHIDSNGNQIKTEMSLMVKFARTRGARGNNMRVGYVDQRSFKLIYRNF